MKIILSQLRLMKIKKNTIFFLLVFILNFILNTT